MLALDSDIFELLARQNFVFVSTLDEKGSIHNACKGIVRAEPEGRIYLLDVYLRRTFDNLRRDPRISITFAEEHRFSGFCLKGTARIIRKEDAPPDILAEWERRLNARISQRLVRNLQDEKGTRVHPEARLPGPQYIIVVEVEEIVDLTPEHLKGHVGEKNGGG